MRELNPAQWACRVFIQPRCPMSADEAEGRGHAHEVMGTVERTFAVGWRGRVGVLVVRYDGWRRWDWHGWRERRLRRPQRGRRGRHVFERAQWRRGSGLRRSFGR